MQTRGPVFIQYMISYLIINMTRYMAELVLLTPIFCYTQQDSIIKIEFATDTLAVGPKYKDT